jgi:hypothetical protein
MTLPSNPKNICALMSIRVKLHALSAPSLSLVYSKKLALLTPTLQTYSGGTVARETGSFQVRSALPDSDEVSSSPFTTKACLQKQKLMHKKNTNKIVFVIIFFLSFFLSFLLQLLFFY